MLSTTTSGYFFFGLFFFQWYANHRDLHSFLHDALPICLGNRALRGLVQEVDDPPRRDPDSRAKDRKSTRLNSSHANISYAVFCLKKKKRNDRRAQHSRPAEPPNDYQDIGLRTVVQQNRK